MKLPKLPREQEQKLSDQKVIYPYRERTFVI